MPALPRRPLEWAKIQQKLGIEDQGLKQFQRAAVLYAELADDFPDASEFTDQLVACRFDSGRSLSIAGEYSQAVDEFKRAERANQTIRERFGASEQFLSNASAVNYYLSTVYRKTDRDREAIKLLRAAVENQKRLIGTPSKDPEKKREQRAFLASLLQQLGLSLRYQHRHDETKAVYRDAVAVLRELAKERPLGSGRQIRLGVLLNDLGVVFFKERDFKQAEAYYRQALAVRTEGYEQYPNEIDHAACLGGSHLNMGNVYRIQNKPVESLPHYAAAIAVLERVRKRDPRYSWGMGMLQASYRCRTESLIQLKRYDAALQDLDQLDAVCRQRWPDDPAPPVRNQLRRAMALVRQGNWKQAEVVIERARSGAATHGDDVDRAEAAYFTAAIYAVMANDKPEPYTNLAMTHLQQAVAGGFDYCDVKEVRFDQDPDFASLWERDDFKRLARANRK